jgi:hypothetical protein
MYTATIFNGNRTVCVSREFCFLWKAQEWLLRRMRTSQNASISFDGEVLEGLC